MLPQEKFVFFKLFVVYYFFLLYNIYDSRQSSHMFNLEVKNPPFIQMMFHVWRHQRGIVRHLRIEQTSLLKQLSWYKFMEILLLCFSNYIYLCFYHLISLSTLKNINRTCSKFLMLQVSHASQEDTFSVETLDMHFWVSTVSHHLQSTL